MITSNIYIFKITPYRESSNMYQAVAKEYGKITLIHKGIRANKKGNALELFTPYKVIWSGKGNIKFLRESESLDIINLTNSHNVVGMYYNELMFYLTKNDYYVEGLYEHYDISLRSLTKSKNFLEEINNYEIGLLILTGHYLIFDIDCNNNVVDKNKKYSYIPDVGPKISSDVGESFLGETLLAMSGNLPYTEITLKESRVLMKRLIDYYIQPKNIKTREILQYISL